MKDKSTAREVRMRLVEIGGGMAQDLGLGRVVGQILACLYLSDGERSLDEMGDELGLLNDHTYASHPEHAADSRWMHRPAMDWARVEKRHDPDTIEGRIYSGLIGILRTRRQTPQLNARYDTDIVDTGHPHVFTLANRHPLGTLACVYNFSESVQYLNVRPLYDSGIVELFDKLSSREITASNDTMELSPYARLWLI